MVVETLNNVLNSALKDYKNLKYCLVDETKKPFKVDGTLAKPNQESDFIPLFELIDKLENNNFNGIGISIQASKICAIDVDKCFKNPFDILSIDERGQQIIDLFKNKSYIEFSFSGTGLRILFLHDLIENFSEKYYIKNSKNKLEYYQPSKSYRYVTVTGRYIYNNPIQTIDDNILFDFLNKFMLKPEKDKSNLNVINEEKSFDDLMKIIRIHYIKDESFQNVWFSKAPGSGADESERDYHILSYIYENITQDKDMIKQLFEASPYFKSKDWKHINKWNYQNFRYFEFVFKQIEGRYL